MTYGELVYAFLAVFFAMEYTSLFQACQLFLDGIDAALVVGRYLFAVGTSMDMYIFQDTYPVLRPK